MRSIWKSYEWPEIDQAGERNEHQLLTPSKTDSCNGELRIHVKILLILDVI